MGKVEQDKIPAAAPTATTGLEQEVERLRTLVEELKIAQGAMIPASPELAGKAELVQRAKNRQAFSGGKADVNATTHGTDRAPDGDHLDKTEGPVRGASREYLPAEYPRRREILGSDGKIAVHEFKRRDR